MIIKIRVKLRKSSVSSDTFLLAWQAGANVRIGKDMSVKIAPMLYSYTGMGSTNGGSANGLNMPYTGQGRAGVNVNYAGRIRLTTKMASMTS